MSGFRVTGIYPFDKSVIPIEAFCPSEVTRITDLISVTAMEIPSETRSQTVNDTLMDCDQIEQPTTSREPLAGEPTVNEVPLHEKQEFQRTVELSET